MSDENTPWGSQQPGYPPRPAGEPGGLPPQAQGRPTREASAPLKPKKPWYLRWWAWALAAFIVIGGIGSALGGGEDDPAPAASPSEAATTEAAEAPVEEVIATEPTDVVGWSLDVAEEELTNAGFEVSSHDSREGRAIFDKSNWVVLTQELQGTTVVLAVEKHSDQATPEAVPTTEPPVEAVTEAPAPAPEPAPEVPAMSVSQVNAVGSARNYLDFMAFSRQGLIDQLEFEDFSTEDATFAVDHVAPDWNEQAAKKAQNYLDFSSFSRQGLIDQLLFEGFSAEQAEFGVAAVGY